MHIVIDTNEIKKNDLSRLKIFFEYHPDDIHLFDAQPGDSEFKLYSYISKKINNTTILDIGTRFGASALALSDNENNKIITYDIKEYSSFQNLKKSNIELKLGDFMLDTSIDYNNVGVIMIDVDPHDGVQEQNMLKFLQEKQWSGILILDDISREYFPAIADFWEQLNYPKIDLSHVGHFSGTGLACIGEKYTVEVQ
jgi:hypothetical protein